MVVIHLISAADVDFRCLGVFCIVKCDVSRGLENLSAIFAAFRLSMFQVSVYFQFSSERIWLDFAALLMVISYRWDLTAIVFCLDSFSAGKDLKNSVDFFDVFYLALV